MRLDTYARLKHAIVHHVYAPGEIVGISELARDLGVSRTPVREALSILERDFLVKLVDMRGAMILPLSVDELLQLNQLREVIDGLAARLAAIAMSDEQIDLFIDKFEALAREREGGDSEAHARLSDELHAAITKASGNRYVQSQWAHLQTAFLRARKQGWGVWNSSPQKRELTARRFSEHMKILTAIKKRDPSAAEAAAREHIANATADLLRLAQPHLP